MICIYQIKNLLNNKTYIGSTKNFNIRKRQHIKNLKYQKHHNIHLQRSYNKNGYVFEFSILEECKLEDLLIKEQEWIDKLKPEYNIGGVFFVYNWTKKPIKKRIMKIFNCIVCNKESRKVSEKRKPLYCNSCRAKLRKECKEANPTYGKKFSDETKEKMRKAKEKQVFSNAKKCSIEGTEYKSIGNAAKNLNLSQSCVRQRLLSNSDNFKNWYFI